MRPQPAEPDVESALDWWPRQRNVWTPVGWKDHQFRFNVVYNGTVIAEPCPSLMRRPHAETYRGKDFQLTFAMYDGGDLPPLPVRPTPLHKLDQGFGIQGWRTDLQTPVLWTEWPSQAWLSETEETSFELMPTVYGPVSLRFRRNGDELVVTYDAAWRRGPARTVLHVPPLPGLRRLTVNGQRYTW